MSKPVFYPYKMKSSSAKLLAKDFGAERVRPDGEFRNNFKRPIINWGNSHTPEWMNKWNDQTILNHPVQVCNAANKLTTFTLFKEKGVKHPEYTIDKAEALRWLQEGAVVARKTLTGKGGAGIVMMFMQEDMVDAPLYTKYFKKKKEYRVHVVDGKIIDFVQKKQRTGVEVNFQVRSHDNGWVFAREGVLLPAVVAEEAVKAVAALGLTFGAVDIGYNEKKNEPCVFEVNTAPGIENTTVINYAKVFKELLK